MTDTGTKIEFADHPIMGLFGDTVYCLVPKDKYDVDQRIADELAEALDLLDASAIRVTGDEYHITHETFTKCRAVLHKYKK